MTHPGLVAATDRYLEIVISFRPTHASALGMHEADDRLDQLDQTSVDSEARDLSSLLRSMGKFECDDVDDTIDKRALAGMIRTRLSEIEVELQWVRNPDLHLQSLLEGILTLVQRDYAPIETRVASLTTRMDAGVRHLESMRSTVEDVPRIWAENALASSRATPDFILGPVAAAIEASESVDPAVAVAARNSAEQLLSALEESALWLESELMPVSHSDWVAGEEVVAARLSSEHFLADTPEMLIAAGNQLIAETTAELDELAPLVASEMGLATRDWRAVIAEAKRDHPDADVLLSGYDAEMDAARLWSSENSIAGRFSATDDAPLSVEATPAFWRHLVPFAAYSPPGPFDTDQSGYFWVTPPEGETALLDHGGGAIRLIAVHEGFPGHHMQLTSANRLDRDVRRLGWSTLLVEGWAFYCEELLWEEGYYPDAVRLMQLKDQLWRACRVVLDISMHTGRTTAAEAVAMLVERAGLAEPNAEAEVRRYTTSPTYQICYAIGKREIVRLRKEVASVMGERFSISDFHETLLEYGSLPTPLFSGALLDKMRGDR